MDNQERQAYAKVQAESYQMGFAALKTLLLSICRTVQVFSRQPGTCGPLAYLVWPVGVFFQICYYTANVDATGSVDWFGLELLLGIQLFWLLCGVPFAIYYRFFRNAEFSFYDSGFGILQLPFQKKDLASINFMSDFAVAGLLSTFFYLVDSPIIGSWYRAMILWVIFAHAWSHASGNFQMMRFRQTQSYATYWANRFQRR